ncbi:MAG: RNA methyltransferase, partial [Acidobacteriota bacterium]
ASVASLVADGANLPTTLGHFDRVVVDVPCSCEGTSRKHPGLLDRPAAEHARYRGRQRALLRKAVQLTRPGGRLVYSTCTYAPEENEEIVAAALTEAAGELRVVPLEPASLRAAPGLDRWQGRDLPIELRGALRVWPHHNDTGGFFVALLEKADR